MLLVLINSVVKESFLNKILILEYSRTMSSKVFKGLDNVGLARDEVKLPL